MSYLGMTRAPEERSRERPPRGPRAGLRRRSWEAVPRGSAARRCVKNRWSNLVRTVKFRHSAYASGFRAPRYWQVRMAGAVY
ncbi:hypothetical protein QF032_003290 [Streptomyces achromogenes]|nr:hypothetical protein [Streptomyces achromogenes]